MSKHIGYKGVSNKGSKFEVTGKGSKKDYYFVSFENGYVAQFRFGDIKLGLIKNPYHPSVYGVGFFGVGDFSANIGGKSTKEYAVWTGMIRRCYDISYQEKHPTYKGCSVAPEWYNFQNFASWITSHKNWGKGYHLDKDLKFLGNKVYSPETCDLVPCAVNTLLIDSAAIRGECAVGVHWCKQKGKYVAKFKLTSEVVKKRQKHLGNFNTEEEAFFAYKKAKEENVKKVAEYYKSEICIEIYNNLMNYEVPAPEFREENTI